VIRLELRKLSTFSHPQSAIRQFAGLIEDIHAAAKVETIYVLAAYGFSGQMEG
jgi:hypothetical protein